MILNKHFATQIALCTLLGAAHLHNCQRPTPPKTLFLDRYCRSIAPFDTLSIEVADDESGQTAHWDTIPNALFFSKIPTNFLQEIDYLADSTSAVVLGRGHFPATDSVECYMVHINEFWFEHATLLVYNKQQKAFTQRLTLAEWYGGESGQVLTGSWMFDYDKDGHYDIVQREIAHSSMLVGDDVQEHLDESAALFLWKNNRFEAAPVADSAAMIKRYPIKSKW